MNLFRSPSRHHERNGKQQKVTVSHMGRNVIDSEHDRSPANNRSGFVQLTEPETNNVIMDFFVNILQNRNFPFTSGCCTFLTRKKHGSSPRSTHSSKTWCLKTWQRTLRWLLGEKDNIKIIQDTVLKLNSIVYQLFRKQMIQESNLNKSRVSIISGR